MRVLRSDFTGAFGKSFMAVGVPRVGFKVQLVLWLDCEERCTSEMPQTMQGFHYLRVAERALTTTF